MSTTRVAFCFPGQGSLEAGMGRDIADAFPEARDVYRIGSEASGLDLERLCFESPIEDLVGTEVQQPALVATSLAILAAVRARGIEPDIVVGHSVGEFAALAAVGAMGTGEAIGLVRVRGLAMAEAARLRPGSMAAILGLEDEQVETLCRKILGVWPANYNCPGQIVISGEDEAVEECCAEAESLGARRAIRLKVSGAFHSPLVARAADRLKPAIDHIPFAEPIKPFMSTVTAKIEPAQRTRVAARRSADGAGALHAGGRRADALGRDDVRRGRPGERPVRAREADRPWREGGVGERPRESREARGVAGLMSFCSLEGKTALVTGGSRGIGRAIALELGRAGASVVVGYRSGAEEAEAVAAEAGGRAVEADVSDGDAGAGARRERR